MNYSGMPAFMWLIYKKSFSSHLDYVMSEMGGASTFVREYTLASGGPYCDCGYKKKL